MLKSYGRCSIHSQAGAWERGKAVQAVVSGVLSGTVSVLSGGKFANGAVTGAFTYLLLYSDTALKVTLNVVGKIWNSANTAIGLVYGGVGYIVGTLMGTKPFIQFGHNAIEFVNNPFGGIGAITLGNAITYGTRMNSDDISGYYGSHEGAHTYQGEILGPLYLPVNVISMAMGLIINGDTHGKNAFMETGPSNRKKPIPW